MALSDEAIGAHLQKNGGGAGTGGAASWGTLSLCPGPGPRALDAGSLGVLLTPFLSEVCSLTLSQR